MLISASTCFGDFFADPNAIRAAVAAVETTRAIGFSLDATNTAIPAA